MDAFSIEIAGFAFRVQPLFETTRLYCREYLTDKVPEFDFAVTGDDLVLEQKLLDLEADDKGLKRRKFPDPFLERSVIQRKIATLLLNRDVLLLHGSTVAVDGQAYLFTAACGTGKSTHTRLWREVFGPRAQMVNDDKPFLFFTDTGVLACGAPWSGKHGLDTNVSLPLAGICILQRGPENRIHPAEASHKEFLFTQRHQPEAPEADRVSHALTQRLIDLVPLWHMTCNKDPEAAQVAWLAMQ
jgi:hypothetical protein